MDAFTTDKTRNKHEHASKPQLNKPHCLLSSPFPKSYP